MKQVMDGQMDLFSILEELGDELTSSIAVNSKKTIRFEPFGETVMPSVNEDYLHREERIMSLIRKKRTTSVNCTTVGDFINLFSKSAVKKNAEKGLDSLASYIIKKIMESVRDSIQKSIVDDTIQSTDENFIPMKVFKLTEDLRKLLGDNALTEYILQLRPSQTGIGICSYYSGEGDYKNIALVTDSSIYKKPQHYSLEKMKVSMTGSERYYRNQGLSSAVRINDGAVLVTRAIMYNSLYNYISNASDDDIVVHSLLQDARNCLNVFIREQILYIDGSEETRKVADKLGLQYIAVNCDSKDMYDGVHIALTAGNIHATLSRKSVTFNLLGLLQMNLRSYTVSVPARYVSHIDRQLTHYYSMLLNIEFDNKNIREYEKAASSDYAKCYQTKKNIPDKVLKAMENSLFNKSFGYVEFDADCDLSKVEELAYEWEAVNSILNQELKSDVSLRFRKLGHHRASGLYYSELQCMCVDIRYPSSFVHEYFHMLDYTNGHLSTKYSFSAVRELYTDALMQSINKDDDLEKKLKKTKYSLDYYLIPTEIFARCAEIYFTKILGINNSLVKPDIKDSSFAYPDDEDLLTVIKNYFDEFMNIYCKKDEKKVGIG